ncbi:MAG: alkaline phosphatase family protein [Pseudobdellovibrionaceae bacterium]|nr:alkaline phosphatase family protein [Bdellovibrionales bacterium]USN47324.1 MAG: alkaline phosphatase family protein [Pseudobdellovibrionaceae bacterium]
MKSVRQPLAPTFAKLWVFFLFLTACAHSPSAIQNQFKKAVELRAQGHEAEAAAIFNQLCQDQAGAACLQMGQDHSAGTTFPLAILQGATSETTTQVAILRKKNQPLEYVLYWMAEGQPQPIMAESQKKWEREDSDWVVDHVYYQELKPSTPYWLDVVGDRGQVIDRRQLKTLDLSSPAVTLAVASCMDDHFEKEQAEIWPEVLKNKPQIIFMIGDNSYADMGIGLRPHARPKDLWRRNAETRNRLAVFRTSSLTPIFAVWDDHDYGANNGDRTYKYKNESAEIFRAFFPQRALSDSLIKGPGVSQYFKGFQQGFLFADNRTFRSPNNQNDDDETHWGIDQENWILENLNAGSMPTWIINGDQIWGGYHKFESYEYNHPMNFKNTMDRLGKTQSPVIFLSGDRHLTEVMAIKPPEFAYPTFEITTSGIHAKTYPSGWDKTPNLRQITGRAESLNYMIIQSLVKPTLLQIDVTAFGPGQNRLYSRRLVVKK